MAKKAVKQPPHLRVRIEPKLIARLEKAREANGNTLTGEIVSRLEASFVIEDKVALLKEAQEKSIEELRQRMAEAREQIERERAEWLAKVEVARTPKGEATIVDVLIGENAEAKEAFRAAVLLLANNPGAAAAIKAAVEEAKR